MQVPNLFWNFWKTILLGVTLKKTTRAPPADKIVNWRLLLRAAVIGGVTTAILFQANGMKGERVWRPITWPKGGPV